MTRAKVVPPFWCDAGEAGGTQDVRGEQDLSTAVGVQELPSPHNACHAGTRHHTVGQVPPCTELLSQHMRL